MTEQWRAAAGFEGRYEVSDQGRVRSLLHGHPKGMRLYVDRDGYPALSLYIQPYRLVTRRVHSLVADAFLGLRSADLQVRHLDGNPANNWLSNLSYGTQAENNLDAVAHGTHPESAKEACPQGHPYDEANTFVCRRRGRTYRKCRTCNYAAGDRYRARRRAAPVASS